MPLRHAPRRTALCAVLILATAASAGRAGEASAEGPGTASGAGRRNAEAGPTPPSLDLRPVFDNWGLPVRVQGQRGTCSAFVVTEAIEYAVAHQQRQATRLSVEFLNWASNQVTGQSQDGGFFSDLWKGYAAFGICPEADMPYQARFDPTAQPSSTALAAGQRLRALGLQVHWLKAWDPHRGLNDAELALVKRTLGRQWPVCGGFLWPKQERWQAGVLQICPREAVRDGHSVLLVGYQDDHSQPGGGVFLIRNSAGPDRDGRLTYEYVRTYMNDAVWISPRA